MLCFDNLLERKDLNEENGPNQGNYANLKIGTGQPNMGGVNQSTTNTCIEYIRACHLD